MHTLATGERRRSRGGGHLRPRASHSPCLRPHHRTRRLRARAGRGSRGAELRSRNAATDADGRPLDSRGPRQASLPSISAISKYLMSELYGPPLTPTHPRIGAGALTFMQSSGAAYGTRVRRRPHLSTRPASFFLSFEAQVCDGGGHAEDFVVLFHRVRASAAFAYCSAHRGLSGRGGNGERKISSRSNWRDLGIDGLTLDRRSRPAAVTRPITCVLMRIARLGLGVVGGGREARTVAG
jgi:hypothetical protein